MGLDKPTRGSFAAAVFGGLAQGLSMVAQNKIANKREDELYEREKADREAERQEARSIAFEQQRLGAAQAADRKAADTELFNQRYNAKMIDEERLHKRDLRDKETARVQGLEDEKEIIRLKAALSGSASKQVDPTKELNTKMGLVGSIFSGMKHDTAFIRDTAKLMTQYPDMDVQKAANYVASDNVAASVKEKYPTIDTALKDSRSGWEDAKISTGDIEPVLLKNGLLPAEELPESDDWTPKDVAMLVAGLHDDPTKIMTDPDTQIKIADMVEEIILSTFVMAPPPSPLRNVPDMSKVSPTTSGMGAYPRSFQAEGRKLADYKTLSEILNQGR